MSDDPEQSRQVQASPESAPPGPAAQTPLLSRFSGAQGPPRTPHLLRFRAEEDGDPEAADCIEEEQVAGSGDQTQGL